MARVLVVEDHELLNRYLCDVIRHAGHHTECVKSQQDAVALIAGNEHDILVCDVLLPDGSGHDLAKMADDRGIPKLMISGDPDEFAKLRRGGVPCLYKPFGIDQLLSAINAELAK